MKERFLIAKGWQGFCDRLQALSFCISVAKQHDRILYVDWNDRIWTHNNVGFYDYFYFSDLPYVRTIDPILKYETDVYPAFWKRGLSLQVDNWIYKLKDETSMKPEEYHYERVWVSPCIGFRRFHYSELFSHLRLDPAVAKYVWERLKTLDKDLPVVHLRGTDRPSTQEAWEALKEKAPVAYVLSDDKTLIDRWMSESPNSVLLSRTPSPITGKGSHYLSAQELEKYDAKKEILNVDLICDFITLAQAKEAYALVEESLFYTIARACGAIGAEKLLSESPSSVLDLSPRKKK